MIFRDPVLVTREKDTYRFVPFTQSKGVAPIWAMSLTVHAWSQISWSSHGVIPGLFRRSGRWTYELSATRFDPGWKDDKRNPFTLPQTALTPLRPKVIAELNRRDPAKKPGDRLERLLTGGLRRTSYVCPQNALIILSWLTLPLALVALVWMVHSPRRLAKPPTEAVPLA